MSSLYRAGPYVPNTPANAGIPTSGALHYSHFYGASGATGGFSRTMTVGNATVGYYPFHYFVSTILYAPIGSSGYDASGTVDPFFYNPGFGSISGGASFLDGGGNSRTVTHAANSSSGSSVNFMLSGTSIPNTDTTFVSISGNSVTLTRSTAFYTASVNGGTLWTWGSGTSMFAASSITFTVTV